MVKIGKGFVTFSTITLVGIFSKCQGVISPIVAENIITVREQGPLILFKKQIGNNLTEDYMQRDIYLIKWLRANDMKVEKTVKRIMEMLQWRKDYKMDTIFEEDFSDLINEFPFTIDGVDHEGRPVGTANIADFDARKVILTGRRDRAIRFVFRMLEIGIRLVIKQHDKGFNITTGTLLVNVDGFNTIQHACSECLPIYRNMIGFEEYYPGLLHRLIAINTPMSFYPVFQVFAPLVSRATRDSIRLYGKNKKQWQEAILGMISPDQIEPTFGGTKEYRRFDQLEDQRLAESLNVKHGFKGL